LILGSVKNLKYLNLGGIQFSGTIPPQLGNLSKLQYLDLSGMAGTESTDMSWLMEHLTSLVFLDLSINNIIGPLPTSIGQYLISSAVLDLQGNNFTGPISKSIGNFTSLRTLDLSANHLNGHVPYEIGMLTNLTELYLNINYLGGVIKEGHFAGIRSLEHIYLSANSLKIELSSEWQPPFRLHSACFAFCQMGPLFPAWLQWHVDIQYLDISSTDITDRLPHWFANAC
ncbi:hypothetical protein BAE44_0000640, partial [Dichanthelium oligosanthes]